MNTDEMVDEIARLRQHVPGPDSVVFDGDWLDHNMRRVFRGERTLANLYEEMQPSWTRKTPLPPCLPDIHMRQRLTELGDPKAPCGKSVCCVGEGHNGGCHT